MALWPFAGEPEDGWWKGDGDEGYGLPLRGYEGFMAEGEKEEGAVGAPVPG